MWHLSQFSKRLELLIKPSNYGYNAYHQPVLVKIPNQIINYLDKKYNIGFSDVEGNTLCFYNKKFSPGTNEVEYYVNVESIDDLNYTSLFVYYDVIGELGNNESLSCIFDGAYVVNFLDTTSLISDIGPNFSNHGAALHQPICDTYAAKTTGGTTYISCNISKTSFTLFFNCYAEVGEGYLVYFSASDYVYLNIDGSLVVKIDGIDYNVGSKLYFNVCSTFSITYDGSNVYIVINGLTKLVIAGTINISTICLGGSGSSGSSIECHFFDLIVMPYKLPLYFYYFHNTIYDNNNFFNESGYDTVAVNGYLTYWPEVIFSGDQVVFRSNIDMPVGWKYYRPVIITNSGTSTIYDYNVVIELSAANLGNPYSNISSDGSDIYFTSISGISLGYCLHYWNNTNDSKIIVNSSGVGGLPVGDSTIYMYYCGEQSVSASVTLELPSLLHHDYFDIKDESYWTFDGYQTVPYILNGKNVLKMWSNNNWKGYYTDEYIVSGMEITIEFLRTGNSSWHIATLNHDNSYHRWCVREYSNGDICVQYRENGGNYIVGKTLIAGAKINVWYVVLLRADDVNDFYMKVWEKDNPVVYGDYSRSMPTGLSWRFCSWQYQNVVCYHDNYRVYDLTYESPITTSVSGEVVLGGTLIDIQENIYKQDIDYSVSFNNGSSWYVSSLEPELIFFKDFGSPQEFDTILRLNYDSQNIDKTYILKINDFNQFDVSVGVDFTAGLVQDVYIDTETDFIVALPTLYGTKPTPVEYAYETSMSGLNSLYFSRPVEISWGGALGSGIISKDVEYCFSITTTSGVDDTEVIFGLSEMGQGHYINYYTYFAVSSGIQGCTDIDVDFVLANWRYFPHQADIICSTVGYNDQDTEIEIGKGRLMRFLSDIKASNMIYDDFNSSVFCSLSGTPVNYQYEVQIISGSIGNYDSDIYCSLVDTNNFGAEIKLNTVVIENFNIDDLVITGTNFCFSIDVYDMYYGVTTSGIQIYMNTNIITGNEVTNKTFLTISGGHTASWCYDIGALSPAEYIEVIVKGTNTYGDLNIASYFLRYGKRYHYNLYHIIKHDYETLIPMLMVAENNVDIFPSFSTETMYIRTENYHRSNLQASIFGVSLDRSELQAEILALTNNFYNGGHYTVRVECSDLSGNEMNPLEFEFTIRSDGL